jgi:hypothetical protein
MAYWVACLAAGLILASDFSLAQAPSTVFAETSTRAYQDKLIDSHQLPDSQEIAEKAYNRTGLPRGYVVETIWDRRGTSSTTELFGLRASGYQDTLYWGSFSGQIGLQQGRNTSNSGFTKKSQQVQWLIRQRGMPLDNGWQLDNAIGQINVPVPELANNSLRLGLPTAGMLGLSSQWRQSSGLQINAALGQAGSFSGFPVASFDTNGGQYAYLSVQDRLTLGVGQEASSWVYGAALGHARDIPSGTGLVNAQSLLLSAKRQWPNSVGLSSAPSSLQVNALHSQNNSGSISGGTQQSANGIWIDGSFNSRGHTNQWGVFYFEPNLSWLDAPVANDLQGSYWRHSWRTRQWTSESNLELLSPIQGSIPAGYFASQTLRYQYSTLMNFGGSVSLRRYNTNGESVLAYTEWAHNLGNTRMQAELARSEPSDKLVRVQIDHAFNVTTDLRFATTLSLDQEKRSGLVSRGFGVALLSDWYLTPNLSFTNSLQSRSSGGQVQYSLNTGLSWRIAAQWSLNATVFAVQGNPLSGTLVQSPLTQLSAASSNLQDKGVFISLRYTEAAGSTQVPIGGFPGSAAGGVQGVIFFDTNGNSTQEASERGVPNVAVLLNGRFSTETDSQGRFEFPYVVAGTHMIQVVSDNLPLPWAMPNEGKQTIRVLTRDQTRVVLGAVKN